MVGAAENRAGKPALKWVQAVYAATSSAGDVKEGVCLAQDSVWNRRSAHASIALTPAREGSHDPVSARSTHAAAGEDPRRPVSYR